jgi:hypothetical protein
VLELRRDGTYYQGEGCPAPEDAHANFLSAAKSLLPKAMRPEVAVPLEMVAGVRLAMLVLVRPPTLPRLLEEGTHGAAAAVAAGKGHNGVLLSLDMCSGG